jgi:hypothetical protein
VQSDEDEDVSRSREQPAHRLLEGEEATRWADLNGMLGDIDRSKAACRRILRLLNATPPDDELVDMLWHYALLSYGRCFAVGVRGVPRGEIIAKLDKSGQAAHEFYMQVRDKFVAHSVNELEQDQAAVLLRDPRLGEAEFLGVAAVRLRAIPSGRPQVQGLFQQCYRVNRVLVRLASPLGQSLHAWARAQELDALYDLPRVQFASGSDSVGQRRPHPQMRTPQRSG